ncbi:MAG TPA: M48 family metalloprotease [Candidatus Berkiella sp.]|nr:M48 family metalloprotease [Candidatus Berkiella sp.]
MKRIYQFFFIIILLTFSACAQNPVTGRPELQFVNAEKEIKMGQENYLYGQQASGGQYRVDPKLSAYVQKIGQKLAKQSGRPDLPYEFVVLNDSVPNAWALPGGKIAVNRGLLAHLDNEAELAAVLGHEITHAAARHGAKAMERQIIMATGLAAANVAIAASHKSSDPAYKDQALAASASVAAGLIGTKYSREAELEADSYGMDYMVKAGYDPCAAVTLQETFVKLMDQKSSHWLDGLFASHPPSQERAKANQQRATQMPKNLELGKERYQQMIAQLKKDQAAYEAYDQGVKALKKEELTQANQAIALVPNEALFYTLQADVFAKRDDKEKAMGAYQIAIEKNPEYFYHYHQRGLLLEKMGKKSEAKADFEKAQKLLPTETAAAALKRLA